MLKIAVQNFGVYLGFVLWIGQFTCGHVLGQGFTTHNNSYECYAITKSKDCPNCRRNSNPTELVIPEINCPTCHRVTKSIRDKYPCAKCSNTGKIVDPKFTLPKVCSVCNGRGILFVLSHKIQVADKDFPTRLNWYDAQFIFSNTEGGWRIPTKEELRGIYEFLHCSGKGEFKNDYYWSSTKGSFKSVYYMNFARPHADFSIFKRYDLNIRAVRDP